MVTGRCLQAALKFIETVLQRNDQYAAADKHVLPGNRPAADESQILRITRGGFADATIGENLA
jgi:hypothetical protein